jgi:DNA-binding PadR family transcriptional regulator
MPIHHAVLALLSRGSSHGYQLKGDFEAAVGPQWGTLNIGHLYQVLDRLSRDGLVTSTRVAQQVKPDRVSYEITSAGIVELDRWLAEPAPRTAGFRDDFFLKVMAAAHAGNPQTVRDVLTTQRGFLLRELRNLETLRRDRTTTDDVVVGLLLSAAARHITADLEFLDDVEQTLLHDNGRALAEKAVVRRARTPRAQQTSAPQTG